MIAECVEFAERYADGTGAKKRLRKLAEQNRSLYQRYGEGRGENLSVAFVGSAAQSVCEPHLGEGVISVCGNIGWAVGRINSADYPSQAVLLRDIYGNPFRPVAFAPEWRTDTAVTLARQMYESRDFGAMPILADALQDAGCDNPDILTHCRDSVQVHVRGCWVCDLVLGKS